MKAMRILVLFFGFVFLRVQNIRDMARANKRSLSTGCSRPSRCASTSTACIRAVSIFLSQKNDIKNQRVGPERKLVTNGSRKGLKSRKVNRMYVQSKRVASVCVSVISTASK